MNGLLRKRWIPVAVAIFVIAIAGATYLLFSDPEADALVERFAQEVSEEASKDAAAARVPPVSDSEFSVHAVGVGLYTKIYKAFDAELGEPASGEAVAEVADAYRKGSAPLDGLRDYIRSKGREHWTRDAEPPAGADEGQRPAASVSDHIRGLVASLGEYLPPGDPVLAIESAVSQGLVSMQDLWERINVFKEGFVEETFEDGGGGSAATSASTPPPPGPTGPTAPRASQNKSNAPKPIYNPDVFRLPDGSFDLDAFNKSVSVSTRGVVQSNVAPTTTATALESLAEKRKRELLFSEGVRLATGAPADTFRKQDGTFDTAAFNSSFNEQLAKGRASKAGSPNAFGSDEEYSALEKDAVQKGWLKDPFGFDPMGYRERDDGKQGAAAAKVGGSAQAAKAFMESVALAESMSERREPYRVFPFPHAPTFIPSRFADDTESLDDRVSAIYRTVFGNAPDGDTRKFLAGRLKSWGGDMRRLSNLVSTMHSMASAEAARRKTARDDAVADVVVSLQKGVSEKEAIASASRKVAEAESAEKSLKKELVDSADALAGPAVIEIAGVTTKLLALMESDGIPAQQATKDVETSLRDWRDAQIAIAEAKAAPRSATDAYMESRDHDALLASRHFENPASGL